MSETARVAMVALLAAATVALVGRTSLGRSPKAAASAESASVDEPCAVPVERVGRGLECLDGERDGVRAGDVIDERGRSTGERMAPARLHLLGVPVDLNRASLAELSSLPGIGPKMARRILEGRPYRSVDDIVRVRGVGRKRLARLRPRLRIGPAG